MSESLVYKSLSWRSVYLWAECAYLFKFNNNIYILCVRMCVCVCVCDIIRMLLEHLPKNFQFDYRDDDIV